MFELSENRQVGQTVEEVVSAWMSDPGWQVCQVCVVPPGEGMLDEVAYVLVEQGARQKVWVVFLKRYEHRRLVGRVCREEEFPAAFGCPQVLLEALVPTSDPLAQRWRLQCWLRARGVQSGELLAWTCDLPWGGIRAGQVFTVERQGERVWFVDVAGARRRVLAWQSFPYALLPGRGEVRGA